MTIWQRRLYPWFGLVLLAGLLLGRSGAVQAEEGVKSRAISIVPSIQELALQPGDVWQGEVKIAVDTPETVQAYLEIVDFRSKGDEGGIPDFYTAQPTEYTGVLSRWMELDQDVVELEANAYHTASVTIRIPENAEPGGHYGAVLFHTLPQLEEAEGGAASSTGTSIASLFLVTVGGEITKSAEIVEFYADKYFYETLPADFTLRIRNSGSVHVRPQGQVVITDWFNREVGRFDVNVSGGNVLPNDIRKFTENFGQKYVLAGDDWYELAVSSPFVFGMYTARLEVTLEEDGAVYTASDRFLVIPWRVVIALLLILIVLFFTLKWLNRRYIRHVIESLKNRKLFWQ